MEEEDEDVMEVSAFYIWEKLPCLNGICLRSVQQVVTDVRREREQMAKTKSDSNNNSYLHGRCALVRAILLWM